MLVYLHYPGSEKRLTCKYESLSFADSAGNHLKVDLVCTKVDCCSIEVKGNKNGYAGRKKLWQLDSPFHCSVIGTCLSLEELRDLCRKMRVSVQAPLTDYELHRSFVGVVAEPTSATRRLHKHLDQKYRTTIRRFAKAQSNTALETLWNESVESGELAGAYWALATHPQASVELVDRVYGEVHMLSHLAGAAVRVDMQELTRLRHLTGTMSKQLADAETKAVAQIADRNRAICQLQERLTRAQATVRDLNEMRERLAALENEPLSRQLRNQIEQYAAKLAGERVRTERAETDAREWKRMAIKQGDRFLHLEGQLAQLQAERDALEATLEKLLSPDCTTCAERDDCLPDTNLCGRCILYVGGRARQCARFRALVERQNGRFIHHDGGLQDGRLRLGSILPQADVVLCPLDCVSHDAANRVKQFCKRHGKRLVLLPRSSLAAFTRGLNELVA